MARKATANLEISHEDQKEAAAAIAGLAVGVFNQCMTLLYCAKTVIGVMMPNPASIARACYQAIRKVSSNTGTRSFKPKNGGELGDFLMKRIFGAKRYA